MHGTDLRATAELRHEEFVGDLRTLVEIESPSDDLSAVATSAEAVERLMRARLSRARIDLLVTEGRTHVRAAWGDAQNRLLLLAHHDTVWPLGTLEWFPWQRSDGILRGPGVFDMKFGVVQAVHALALLEAHDPASLRGVVLLVTGDEEIGSPSSRPLIEQEAAGCSAVLVVEASADGGALKTERKGVSLYRLSVVGKAAHAGLEPHHGVNAVVELAQHVVPVSQLGDIEAGTTVTPTVIDGGTTSNTVPEAAALTVDVRAWTTAEQQRVDRELRSLRPVHSEATLVVEGGINRPALEGRMSRDLYELCAQELRLAGIPVPAAERVGGASDGNFTAGLGVPTLDGLGAVGGGAHAPTEHALESAIDDRVTLLALLMRRILSGGSL